MVSQGKNNDLPDKDILIRYLQGKLPPDEAHRIEKLILNNPLYQEALDGLETLSQEELEQDLKDLSQQISAKTHSSAKSTAFSFYRVAAAIILLAVFSYVIVYTTSRMGEVSRNETLSQKEELPDEVDRAGADALVEESDNTETQHPETENDSSKEVITEQVKDITVSDPLKESSEEIINIAEEKTGPASALSETQETEAVIPIEESLETASPEESLETASPEQSPEVLAVALSEESPEEPITEGREDSYKPVEEEEPKLIDQEQDLEIQEELSAVARTNEAKSIDIQDYEIESVITEQQAERAKISGEQAPVLSDYLDSTRGKRKENKLARQAESQAAGIPEAADESLAYSKIDTEDILIPVPADGYKIYAEYISENLNYPAEELEKKIEGRVKLRFIINKDSIPDKIRIVQSLSPDCDKEAKRLLMEGPKWIPFYKDNELNEIELEYSIYFQVEN
jgi:hypothetical protein